MKRDLFRELTPRVKSNKSLREPQELGYWRIKQHYDTSGAPQEVGIVLPVGCGKSGLITLVPFAVGARRALVIAPGTNIAHQLYEKDFNPAHEEYFYRARGVLDPTATPPEAAEIRGTLSNVADLEVADVVITNIQQLQGEGNRWLLSLPSDFFDLILVDEAHHNVAQSWVQVREHFAAAKVVNFSATPARADGQVMAGDIIYSYPVVLAIQAGYVKHLRAVVLNPRSLRFVREQGGAEMEVSQEEVRRLGESDADFRRSILSSRETLNTIIDVSIDQLRHLRRETREDRHKLIVSALNHRHCIQIAEAYRARQLRVEHIHTNEDSKHNERVLRKLENDELDGIVQVRKLGEGFDHRWLSVAVVCNLFSNLSPFVQFVGRVMRAVDQGNPASPNNRGIVVFHAGANVAKRWEDFKDFSGADQEYFENLLPTENVIDFSKTDVVEVDPIKRRTTPAVTVLAETDVALEEDDLVPLTDAQRRALDLLLSSLDRDQLIRHVTATRLTPRKQDARRAARKAIDEEIARAARELLARRKLNGRGHGLDGTGRRRSNFVVLKSALDVAVSDLVGVPVGERCDWTAEQLELAKSRLPDLVARVERKVIDGAS